jgi:3-deoxy-D-manno-octulosonic-acid transferase
MAKINQTDGAMMWRFFYSLLFYLALPLVLLRLWRRGKTELGYRQHIAERFAFADICGGKTGAIWIHAVSVGEVRAALPLIGKLTAAYPNQSILVTCMTPTGRRTARDLLASHIRVAYLPYDLPVAMHRLVRRIRPHMLIVMETEIWPNLLTACQSYDVPRFLVNARLSEKSRAGYIRFMPIRALIRNAMKSFTAVMAQSEADASRLVSIGANHVSVMGNVKFDLAIDEAALQRGEEWKQAVGQRKVLLLASTREGEESMLANAFLRIADWPVKPLLVVVPRHPSRFDDICNRLEDMGLAVMRRSAFETTSIAATLARADVVLGDSMGEMQAYFAMCDVAIIGGSFKALGGQNLIEAAALGKPIIMGPSTFNFSEAVALAIQADAMRNVRDADEAMKVTQSLLADESLRTAIGENARNFAATHRGATARTVDAIARHLNTLDTVENK